MDDLISRQAAIDAIDEQIMVRLDWIPDSRLERKGLDVARIAIEDLPSAQPERYTKEELRVFQHGISLSLLSKRSAQYWCYDEDTATEIEFLERLYEKVGADMRGGQDDR